MHKVLEKEKWAVVRFGKRSVPEVMGSISEENLDQRGALNGLDLGVSRVRLGQTKDGSNRGKETLFL